MWSNGQMLIYEASINLPLLHCFSKTDVSLICPEMYYQLLMKETFLGNNGKGYKWFRITKVKKQLLYENRL